MTEERDTLKAGYKEPRFNPAHLYLTLLAASLVVAAVMHWPMPW